MIRIDNLKKQFGETIASDIPSFQINDGDITVKPLLSKSFTMRRGK